MFGVFGQGLRAGLGLKKLYDSGDWKWEFEWRFLVFTLALGAACGMVAVLSIPAATPIFLIAAGYAGSDFIEGTLKAFGPK